MANKGKVEIVVEAITDGAKKSIQSLESGIGKVGSAALSVGKVAAAGFGALTTAVGAVGAAALDAYADYEQFTGGISKLFGTAGMSLDEYAASVGQSTDEAAVKFSQLESAQQTVFDNAAKAYETAGMSANKYMETATSISASLISSLGGDTQEAANQVDVAIQSMSDNVNTFGTDIESVRAAYAGFAKQNYTMLDNLSLGYGGTKSEMERLIADANEYGASVGKASDLTIDSFSDIVTAIELIQEKQGIAGTTAKEAAGTISGSLAMAQAAWENLLTGIADSDADLSDLTNKFLEAIGAVAQNVVPRVAQIGKGIIEALPAALSGLSSVLAPVLSEALAAAWNIAVGALAGLGISLPTIEGSQIIEAFSAVVEWGQQAFNKLQEIVSFIAGSFVGAWNTLSETVSGAVTGLVEAVSPFADYFTLNMLPVLVSLGSTAVSVFAMIQSAVEPVATFLSTLANVVSSVLYNAFVLLTPIVAQAISLFNQIVAVLTPIISQIIGAVMPALTSIATALGNLANAVLPLIASALQVVMDLIQMALPVLSTIASVVTSAITVIITLVSQIIATVVNLVAMIVSYWAMLAGIISTIVTTVTSVVTTILTVVGGFISTIVATIAGFVNTVITFFSSMVNSVISFITGLFTSLANTFSMIVSTLANAAQQVYSTVTGAFASLVSSVAGSLSNVVSTVSTIPSRIIGIFAGAGSWLLDAGAQIINGLTRGIQNAIGGAISAVTNAVGSVISSAKSLLGIASPSKVFDREIGRMIPRGAARGVKHDGYIFEDAVDDVFSYSPSLAYSDATIGAGQVAAAQSAGTIYQTLNFNQPVQSPAEMARAVRMQNMYGLAAA